MRATSLCLLCCIGSAASYAARGVRRPQLPRRATSVNALAEVAVSEDVLRLLQVAPPVASQILFLSPLSVMNSFREEGTKDASALPYAAMVANGAAWVAYGALAPAPDLTIMLANVGGVLFGLYYCAVFASNMSKSSDGPLLFSAAFGVVAAIVAAAGLLPAAVAHEYIGYAGVALCVLMFSGPLASVQAILRDCCASSLPIGFTVATVCNCLLWCGYGALAIHDPLIWGPNVAGLVASATQLALYDKYGDNMEGCEMYEEGCLLPVP